MGFGGGGPQGPAGPAGADGADGAPGATGPEGPAGSANISGTTGKLVKFTGEEAGGDSVVSEAAGVVTVAGPLTQRLDANAASRTTGLALDNTTPSTSGVPVQKPGTQVFEGRAWSTAGGGSDVVTRIWFELVPVSGAVPTVDLEIRYSNSAGSGRIGRWRIATTSLGSIGLELDGTVVLGGSSDGVRSVNAGNPGIAPSNTSIDVKTSATDGSARVRSSRTDGTAPILLWADAGAKIASEIIVAIADGSGTPVIVCQIMGDGVIEGPSLHTDTTAKTGTFTAALDTAYLVDLSAARTANLPAATDANIGRKIQFNQSVAGANALTLTPASGTIEGQASFDLLGVAAITSSIAGARITVRSFGASAGWKVV